MSIESSSQRERFLYAVAGLYYNEGRTQEEVAELLGVSRAKVLRALQEARAVGIVQITIVDPSATNEELAAELERTLGLTKAVVTPAHPTDGNFTRQRVAHAAASYLKDVLPDGGRLGIGWGRTLYEVTQTLEFSRRYDTQVVPLLGGLAKIAPSFQVHDTARVAAEKLGGAWRAFYVPALVDSAAAYDSLMASSDVSHVTAAWRDLDVALVGIGNVDLGPDVQMLFADYVDSQAADQLRSSGAVGDICMRFFDIHGAPIDGALRYLFSIELEQLAAIPRKIAVACGLAKAGAILGAVRGGYVNALVTDSAAATEVLRLAQLPHDGSAR